MASCEFLEEMRVRPLCLGIFLKSCHDVDVMYVSELSALASDSTEKPIEVDADAEADQEDGFALSQRRPHSISDWYAGSAASISSARSPSPTDWLFDGQHRPSTRSILTMVRKLSASAESEVGLEHNTIMGEFSHAPLALSEALHTALEKDDVNAITEAILQAERAGIISDSVDLARGRLMLPHAPELEACSARDDRTPAVCAWRTQQQLGQDPSTMTYTEKRRFWDAAAVGTRARASSLPTHSGLSDVRSVASAESNAMLTVMDTPAITVDPFALTIAQKAWMFGDRFPSDGGLMSHGQIGRFGRKSGRHS